MLFLRAFSNCYLPVQTPCNTESGCQIHPQTRWLAVTIFSQIQVVLSCVLLAATIFWTCIKITKPLKDFHEEE